VTARTRVLRLALALAMGGALPANANVLCRTRAGAVHVRDACRRHEKIVDLAAGAKGASGDQGPAAIPAARVVDATGKPVGIVAEIPGFKDNTMVVVPVGPRFVHVSLEFPNDRLIYFVSADCTGSRFVPQKANALFRNATVFGGAAYYAEDPIAPVTTKSFLYAAAASDCISSGNTPVADGCCQMQNDFAEKGPLTIAFPMSALGTPPFHVEF